jgi:hypothetical protein
MVFLVTALAGATAASTALVWFDETNPIRVLGYHVHGYDTWGGRALLGLAVVGAVIAFADRRSGRRTPWAADVVLGLIGVATVVISGATYHERHEAFFWTATWGYWIALVLSICWVAAAAVAAYVVPRSPVHEGFELRLALHRFQKKLLSRLTSTGTAPVVDGAAETTRTCPDCAEAINAGARFCQHCGSRQAATPNDIPAAQVPYQTRRIVFWRGRSSVGKAALIGGGIMLLGCSVAALTVSLSSSGGGSAGNADSGGATTVYQAETVPVRPSYSEVWNRCYVAGEKRVDQYGTGTGGRYVIPGYTSSDLAADCRQLAESVAGPR